MIAKIYIYFFGIREINTIFIHRSYTEAET
ncbi:hypothetical protein G159_16125 [Planococcus glaciei CHR43]|nr:hypothetical protein G159_16125 [Planococcus glaciei CHR43]